MSRVYRSPEHLCKLYKAFLKEKEKEVNFTEHYDPIDDSTHLDTSDFTDDFADKNTGGKYIYECIIMLCHLCLLKLSLNIIFHL